MNSLNGNEILVYLAGPDVFSPKALQILEEKKLLCEKYGFIGLSPIDNEITNDCSNKVKVREIIRKKNEELIKRADIIIADLNPFRGFEPDSGTCYEIGFASALGKKVYVYLDECNLSLRARYAKYNFDSLEYSTDNWGNKIEDFKFSLNLMFSGTEVKENFKSCLEDCKKRYTKEK